MKMPQLTSVFCCIFLANGCASSVPVQDWQTLPADQEIRVHTKGGSVHSFSSWRSDGQGGIIGMFKEYRRIPPNRLFVKTHVQRIPADSIAVVYALDTRGITAAKIATITIGSAAGLAILWLLVDFLHRAPFL